MKVKVIAALMMTVVLSLAAFASEQRRICNGLTMVEQRPVITDESREATIIAMKVNVAN